MAAPTHASRAIPDTGLSGLIPPSGRRDPRRRLGDVVVELGFADRELVEQVMVKENEADLPMHLVLSTLHTDSSSLAPARLIDMGVEPFLIAPGIGCVVGQRLARCLCTECKRPTEVREQDLAAVGAGMDDLRSEVYEPVGCRRCNGTGYRGRVGLYEVLLLTDEIRALVMDRAPAAEIEAAATAAGMHLLRQDGHEKTHLGITSIPEVVRVLGSSAG